MTTTPLPSFWISPSLTKVDSICFGTGRFLRAVWVPALQAAHYHPILVQPRGRSFVDYCLLQQQQASNAIALPVDTVLASGDIETDGYDCYGAFSWGTERDQDAFYQWKQSAALDTTKPLLIAVGVTEAGLASPDTVAMQQLHRLLLSFIPTTTTTTQRICVLNTDNVPHNGSVIRTHMMALCSKDEQQQQFLKERVVFLNSMVDRITSHRANDLLVPRAEPQPAKAFVVADLEANLPAAFHRIPGIVLRSTSAALNQDMAYKLRIANGTHTAVAHALALASFPHTDVLSSSSSQPVAATFMTYLDALAQHQILLPLLPTEATAVWEDWRLRLLHPHFGLSSFFIAQNGAAKGGIRLGPTVADLLRAQQTVTVAMAWAFAVLLRYLTPAAATNRNTTPYRGWLSQCSREQVVVAAQNHSDATEEYADQLSFNLQEGWYEFRCSCTIHIDQNEYNLSDCLAGTGQDVNQVVRAYLVAEQGGNLQDVSHLPYFDVFAAAVAHLYAELVAKNHVLDSLEQLVKTNTLNNDCQTLISDDLATNETNFN